MSGFGEALVSVFLKYLVEQVEPSISIQNTPTWYMKEIDDSKYTKSGYFAGGLDSVEKAKQKLKVKFIKSIDRANTLSLDAINATEFAHNNDVKGFVEKSIKYENIKYSKEHQRAFVRGYILKSHIETFQKKRLFVQKVKLLDMDFEKMMFELENTK